MRIGESVLGTYGYFSGEGAGLNRTDIRQTGMIDSPRMPLGFYWVKFDSPEGNVRQMNHESEIGGDPRQVVPAIKVRLAIFTAGVEHFRAGGHVAWSNGERVKAIQSDAPVREEALQELADIGQEEVIL